MSKNHPNMYTICCFSKAFNWVSFLLKRAGFLFCTVINIYEYSCRDRRFCQAVVLNIMNYESNITVSSSLGGTHMCCRTYNLKYGHRANQSL